MPHGSHCALLHAVQVRLKSVSNEGHFTLEAETVIRPYLPSHCSGVTEKFHVALSAHALQAAQFTLTPISNEGHFTLEAKTVSPPYLPSHFSRVTQYATWHSLRMRYVQCKLDCNRCVMKGALLFRSKQFFIHISPHISVV
jgi:hypothetical protein